jgi:hypothetical protein
MTFEAMLRKYADYVWIVDVAGNAGRGSSFLLLSAQALPQGRSCHLPPPSAHRPPPLPAFLVSSMISFL